MCRRAFMALFAGAAPWPLALRAQQGGKLPTIGILGPSTAAAASQWIAALTQRLLELGWIEGRTFTIEYRWAQGRADRAAEIAAELVRLNVDVIVTAGNTNAAAAKQASSTIPVIFVGVGDPVGVGLVASLARPGGNLTGLSNQSTDLAAKRIELLREAVPDLRRLAVIVNPDGIGTMLEMSEVRAAAVSFGLQVVPLEVRRAEDIAGVFETIKDRADALNIVNDRVTFNNRHALSALALRARLPTSHGFRAHVEAGGLMSYGPNFHHLSRRAGDYVDKVLRGAKPGDIPVEQPTKFDLVINLKTAKALGLDIPPMLLARADEVIE